MYTSLLEVSGFNSLLEEGYMPEAPQTQVILNEIKHLNENLNDTEGRLDRKLDVVDGRLQTINGLIGKHESWIAQNLVVIEQIKDRQDVADDMLVAHQKFIDQRASAIQEFDEMKKHVADLRDWKAGQTGVKKYLLDAALILTMLASVYAAVKPH